MKQNNALKYVLMFPYSENYSQPTIDNFFEGFAEMPKEEKPIQNNGYLVDTFLKQKLDFHKWNLDSLKHLLLSRLDINYKNHKTIDYLIGQSRNQLMKILNFPLQSQGMLQRRTELDKLISNLYQQKITENNALWKDLNLLQRDIAVGVKYFKNWEDLVRIGEGMDNTK